MRARVSIPLLVGLLLACSTGPQTDAHWDRARDLMLQAELKAGPDGPDYAEEVWGEVLDELGQVDPRYRRAGEAAELIAEIGPKREEALAARKAGEAAHGRQEEIRQARLEETLRSLDDADPFDRKEYAERGRYQLLLVDVIAEREAGRMGLRGTVRNLTERPLTNTLVLVDFQDERKRPVLTVQGVLDPPSIPPSGMGSFHVTAQENQKVARYLLRFRELSGAELSYRGP
jgi:hypothetical protein